MTTTKTAPRPKKTVKKTVPAPAPAPEESNALPPEEAKPTEPLAVDAQKEQTPEEKAALRARRVHEPEQVRTREQRIAESREALKHPLNPGQRFFESPEGFVMVGEADKDHVWCREADNGKGAWINPRR